jgi:hypothetical protein
MSTPERLNFVVSNQSKDARRLQQAGGNLLARVGPIQHIEINNKNYEFLSKRRHLSAFWSKRPA